jgi:hypothetical protein
MVCAMVKEKEINLEFSSELEMKYHDIDIELKKYETNIKFMFKEKNYYKIIVNGTNIIEQMLELILKRKNNLPNNTISMIEHTIKTESIPIKTKNTLFEINRIPHEINEKNVNYKQTQKFLKTFKKFIIWFNTENELYGIKIDNCIELIDNLPNTEPVLKNRNEEKDYIKKINESLKNLEKYLKLVSKENYAGAIIEGYNVCNLMLELFLKNEDYTIDNGLVIQGDEKTPIILFCSQNNLFPKECREFFKVIHEYNDEFLKLDNSYTLAFSFLKGLSFFILWFDNFYSEKYSINKPFKIENCYAEISKLTYTQEDNKIFKRGSSNTKKQKSEISVDNGLPVNFQENISNLDLLQAIYKMGEDIKNHVTEEAEKIRNEIKNISLKITGYQSLIERQINNFDTDEEKDKIIAAFADECAERIINETTFKEEDSYNSEKTNLINSLGESAWAKLSAESQTYLISSKLMFNNLNDISEIVDYSGVCILVTKTLEVELYKRFYDNFLNYLDKKRYKKYDNYPTGLLYKNRELLNEDKFNLGTVAYIFCIKRDYYIDYYQEKNNEEKLIEYCEEDLFNDYETATIEKLIKKFGNTIEKIRKDYRNPSAHRNNITKDKAEMCLDLVLYNKNPLLREMLDSFKM